MSDEKVVGIKIVSYADTTGAKQTADSFKSIQGATGELKDSLSKLNAAQEEGKDTAEHLHVSHKALHKIFHEIGAESAPELGHALTGALYGPIGIAIALGAAVEFVSRKIKEQSEAAGELRQKQAELDTAVWDAQEEAVTKAATAAASYAATLKRIAENSDEVKQKEELRLAVLNAEIEAQKALLAAQEKAALAAAGDDEFQKEMIKARYGEAKTQQQIEGEKARIAAQEQFNQEESKKKNAAASAFAQAHSATEAFSGPGSETGAAATATRDIELLRKTRSDGKNSLESDFLKATGGKTLAEADSNLAAKRAFVEAHKGEAGTEGVPGMGGGVQENAVGRARRELAGQEKALHELEENQKQISANNAVIRTHNDRLKELQDAEAKAKSELEKWTHSIQERTAKIETDKAVLAIHQKSAGDVGAVDATQSPIGQALLSEKGDSAKILTGHADQVGEESKNVIEKLGAMLAGHTVTLQQAAAMISQADANAKNFNSAIAAFNQTSDQMERTSATSIAKLTQVMDALKSHARQLQNLHSGRANSGLPTPN